MNIQSFAVSNGDDYDRGMALLNEARRQQGEKPDKTNCTRLIDLMLKTPEGGYLGTTFVTARDSAGKLCGIAIYSQDYVKFYIDFICSDCPGTGREIINSIAAQASAARKWRVGLTSVAGAVGYYERIGFTRVSKNYMELPVVPAPRPPAGPAAAGAVPPEGGRRKTRRRKTRRQVKSRH